MSKAKTEELGEIWGPEINEKRAETVSRIKSKYPMSGYDLMLHNFTKNMKNNKK